VAKEEAGVDGGGGVVGGRRPASMVVKETSGVESNGVLESLG
jgi:hypothetical protein